MIFTNIFTIVHLCPKGIPFLDTLLRHLQSPQCYFPPDRDTNGEDDVDVDDVCGDTTGEDGDCGDDDDDGVDVAGGDGDNGVN